MALLAAALALAPLAAYAGSLRITGTGSAVPALESLAAAYMGARPETTVVVLPTLGSTGSINALLADALDIAFSARPLRVAEAAAGLVERLLARTALVLVSSKRIVDPNLDQSQIVSYFTGSVRTWPDGSPVRLILRPPGDSDTAMLVERYPLLGPGLEAVRLNRGIPVTGTDQETVDLAVRRSGSLTTSTLAMVRSRAPSLTLFSIDGVAPSLDSIADGSYPLVKTYRVVTPAELSPAVADFVRFLATDEAATILRSHGALPVSAAGS